MCSVSLLCLSSGSMSTLNLTIQTFGNVSSVNAQPVRCEVIGSLISIFREFRALCLLQNGPMLRPVLAPHVSYFTHTLHSPPDLDTSVSWVYLKQWWFLILIPGLTALHILYVSFI